MNRSLCLLVLLLMLNAARAVEFTLATDGKATCGITISAKASERTQAAAKELGTLLQRITGGEFPVAAGEGKQGIVIGLASEFPGLTDDERLTDKAITARENYFVRSEEQRLVILGNTERGVEHAVWDVLHHLGVRQYFPGPHWEIVPRQRDLSVEMSSFESPAFHSRLIWYGYGAIPERKADYEAWCRRNRATRGIDLLTGHAYGRFISRNKAAFDAHPEYYALVKGERAVKDPNAKLCISNAALRKLLAEQAVADMDADPELDSVSAEPSDGGGWCECKDCVAIGSPSDRALLLSNDIATAIQAKHPGKLVGQYAYNEHSPVPSILAVPGVVVSIAAGFIKGGATMDDLLDGWSQHAQQLGIREYLSVFPWDHDLPGQARGAQLDYLQETIPHYHEKAARFYSAEASDNWGCNGLGYYMAARMLWDVDEAGNVEAMFDDFLDHSFGAAKLPMTRFYTLINRTRPPLSDDLIGRMYRYLKEAGDNELPDDTRARIDDLILYTRACELRMDYESATGPARQAAFEALLRHAWRIRDAGMVHVMGLWRDAPKRDKAISLPKDCEWGVPAASNPWKQGQAYTREEVDAFVSDGIEHHELAGFETASFSSTLVPATALALKDGKPGDFGTYGRGKRSYWTWVDKAPATLELKVTGGLVYQNQGPVRVSLYPAAETQGASVSEGEAPPNKEVQTLTLKTSFTGLHRIEVEDHRAGSKVELPAGQAFTFDATFDQAGMLNGRHTLYFYVPRRTLVVGGYSDGEGKLVNAAGKTVLEFSARPGYFSVPVTEGQDGQPWKFENTTGKHALLTVPPQLARHASELLLPKEVVESDSKP